jgi:outer membrane lipoprotein-sorting protein
MKPFSPFQRLIILLLVSSAASLMGTAEEQTNPESWSATQILGRMAEVYAGCKTYRDAGLVKEVFFAASGDRTVEKPFKTAFIRPDRFRFEYRENNWGDREDIYIVWRQGKSVKTWWDIKPGVKKEKSLSYALAGPTGVSSGSAHTIPALLMPDEIGGSRLNELEDPKRIEDGKFDHVDCFRIEASYEVNAKGIKADTSEILWIDRSTFLVRRIDEKTKFDTFRLERTTTYDPVLDGEITDQMLEFNPPKHKW